MARWLTIVLSFTFLAGCSDSPRVVGDGGVFDAADVGPMYATGESCESGAECASGYCIAVGVGRAVCTE
jgi:hypothetical protein